MAKTIDSSESRTEERWSAEMIRWSIDRLIDRLIHSTDSIH
jgi:hypothetical protein